MAKKKKAAGKPKPAAKKKAAPKKPVSKKPTKKPKPKIETIEDPVAEEEAQIAADNAQRHELEPKANLHGVFVDGLEEIEIPLPKSYKSSAVIDVVQASDGTWHYGYAFHYATGGASGGPSMVSEHYETREAAIHAAILHGIEFFELNEKPKEVLKLKEFKIPPAPVVTIKAGDEVFPGGTAVASEPVAEVVTLDRDNQPVELEEYSADSELLDEIVLLERSCRTTLMKLNAAKEVVKDLKKLHDGQVLDLLNKISERDNDDKRPLFNQNPRKTRAEKIAEQEPTTPTDAPISSDDHSMDWQKISTKELHLEQIPKIKQELVDRIECDYPTMGKLVELHQQGTGKDKGLRTIVGLGKNMADEITRVISDWLAKVRDGWGKPAADHQDFTGANAPAEEPGADLDAADDGEPEVNDGPAPTSDEVADLLAGPTEVDLLGYWSKVRTEELRLSKQIVRKLLSVGLIDIGAIEAYRGGGGTLADIHGLSGEEAAALAAELSAAQEDHGAFSRLNFELSVGRLAVDLTLDDGEYFFNDGRLAATDKETSPFSETRELTPYRRTLWLAGYIFGLKEQPPAESAAA